MFCVCRQITSTLLCQTPLASGSKDCSFRHGHAASGTTSSFKLITPSPAYYSSPLVFLCYGFLSLSFVPLKLRSGLRFKHDLSTVALAKKKKTKKETPSSSGARHDLQSSSGYDIAASTRSLRVAATATHRLVTTRRADHLHSREIWVCLINM